ncbi:MAG TPA: hypothetical protein VGG41_13305 [Solirubrobacteraceae bacterium]
MSEPDQMPSEPDQDPPPSEASDDVTVGAWLDTDQAPYTGLPEGDVVLDPAPARPSLWARLMRALRGAG